MKRFVQFVSDMHSQLYETTMTKIVNQKIPVAIYLSSVSNPGILKLLRTLLRYGINLKYVFSTDTNDSNLPEGLQLLPLPPKSIPEVNIVMMDHDVDGLLLAQKFRDAGMEVLILEPSGTKQPDYDLIMSHIDDIFEVYQSLIDEESRESYLGCMLARVSGKISYAKFSNLDQYLLPGFLPKAGDIFIDGGACDGGTASMFTDFGCRVIAFEMDRENFVLTSRVAAEKKFVVENLGLGDENREVSYSQGGNWGASAIYSGSDDIPPDALKTRIVTLDSYVREKNLPSVDFIKLDIEGSELSMLKGAADTLARFKPTLAISAYHKPDDLWTLQQFIKSIRPDYEFAFRHFETTYESAPYIFSDFDLALCRKFDLPLRLPGLGEFVLFAR